MRSKTTIEFLGLWEQLNNPDFKGDDFDPFYMKPVVMLLHFLHQNGLNPLIQSESIQNLENQNIKKKILKVIQLTEVPRAKEMSRNAMITINVRTSYGKLMKTMIVATVQEPGNHIYYLNLNVLN